MAESCGSMPASGEARATPHQLGMVADAGSINAVAQILQKAQPRAQLAPADAIQRKPLQEANRDISAHPVRVSNTQGTSLSGPDKVSVSQQQSTAAFKEKHLRQMRAANERLEQIKLRSGSVSNSENSRTNDARPQVSSTQKRSSGKREVVQTHVNVSKLVSEHNKGQSSAKPSTEALLRAASVGQHGTGRAAASRLPRTSSLGKGKPNSEAPKKKVYSTLQSPNLEAAVVADCDAAEGHVDDAERLGQAENLNSIKPPQQPEPQKKLSSYAERSHASTHNTVKARDSTDSQRQSKDIPRSVAALANRFEGRAETVQMKHTPGPSRPNTVAQAPQVPPAHVGAAQSALPKAPTSGGATAARIHTPTQPWRKAESTPAAKSGESSGAPVDSAGAFSAPQDPRRQRKAASAIGKPPDPPASHAADDDDMPVSIARAEAAPQGRVLTPPRPRRVTHVEPPQAAVPAHVAFGSPMHGYSAAADEGTQHVQPARNSMLSMSCNVNMGSPTAADGEVVSAWKQPPAGAPVHRDGRENVEQVNKAHGRRAADKRPPKLAHPHAEHALEKPYGKGAAGQGTAASPPTRAALARLSDACTSPVESLWRPLKKALTPQSEHDDDAMLTSLLAADGSPAMPGQQYAANSPQKSPAKARPSTAAGALGRPSTAAGTTARPSTAAGVAVRPSTAGSTKPRPATAGPMRTFPSRPILHGSEADASASESSADHSSRQLHTGPDRAYSVGSTKHGLEPAVSRGALEMSAAHLRGSLVEDEPFVDLMGVHVDSAYLKSGRSGASGGGCCSIM